MLRGGECRDTPTGTRRWKVYAGNGVSATTAGSSHAVSQYDVACYQVSHR